MKRVSWDLNASHQDITQKFTALVVAGWAVFLLQRLHNFSSFITFTPTPNFYLLYFYLTYSKVAFYLHFYYSHRYFNFSYNITEKK